MENEKETENIIDFFYQKCIRCDYKECKKKKENLIELENALTKIKNHQFQEITNLTGINF